VKLLLTFIFLVNIFHLDQSRDQVTKANIAIENESSLRGYLYSNPLNLKVESFLVHNKIRISSKLSNFIHDAAFNIENSITKLLVKNSIITNAPLFYFS